MKNEANIDFYNTSPKYEVLMAVLIGIGICLTRLATAVSQIALAIATILAAYLWWKNGKRLNLNDTARQYIKIVCIWFIASFVSIIDVDDKAVVFYYFLGDWIWRFMVFVLVVAFIHRREYLLKILAVFFCIFSIDCLIACYQFFILHWERGRGFHGDYLDLTAIICMVLAMSAIILLDSHFEKNIKKFALLGLVSSIAGLFGCFGRGAFLVSALVAPFYLYYYLRNSKKMAAIILIILCLLGGAVLSSPKYIERLSTTLNTTTNRSNVDRIWAWKASWDMFQDHYINGVGLNNWGWYYRNEGYKYDEETQNLPHAHSNYMQPLAETGTIGFLGLLYFYGFSLIIPFKKWIKEHNPCDLIFFTAFLACMVLFGAFQPTYRLSSVIRTMWFILALMIQLRHCTIDLKE
ncbi:O-antigen ligase family protein [Megasphaera elsdenii]|uniref:O-antigen ligase family protein n=1 Tax=Megasphaera elsdenii TaxID=907 RepID=UPI001959A015|nr:O-antigen ligase family protein [Megasphaera elsdenii]MBM6701568.1 O-antigen ligase family protein [Megasphaera elsdenii]